MLFESVILASLGVASTASAAALVAPRPDLIGEGHIEYHDIEERHELAKDIDVVGITSAVDSTTPVKTIVVIDGPITISIGEEATNRSASVTASKTSSVTPTSTSGDGKTTRSCSCSGKTSIGKASTTKTSTSKAGTSKASTIKASSTTKAGTTKQASITTKKASSTVSDCHTKTVTANSVATASATAGVYTDWTTFKANGVNLGGWLEIEYSNNQYFWDSNAPNLTVQDEWHFCEDLGTKCGPIMEEHYATWITTSDIDTLATVGVDYLRIATGYNTWINVTWSSLYHGNQQAYLRTITEYAIATYGMRVAIDLHSLPGGVNGLDIGEAIGHDDWFYNATNLALSLTAIDNIISFIEASKYPWAFTIEPLNEASDNITGFATATGLTAKGTTYIVDYVNSIFSKLAKSSVPKVPVMLQDCFLGETFWSGYFANTTNLVIDTHVYYFAAAGVYSVYADATICGQASVTNGDNIFPVMVGEWSLQVMYNNTYAYRPTLFNTQRYAWHHYVAGGTFWSAKFNGSATVDGEGTQKDYWSYLDLISAGVITAADNTTYC